MIKTIRLIFAFSTGEISKAPFSRAQNKPRLTESNLQPTVPNVRLFEAYREGHYEPMNVTLQIAQAQPEIAFLRSAVLPMKQDVWFLYLVEAS
jgi:hypothetical protein